MSLQSVLCRPHITVAHTAATTDGPLLYRRKQHELGSHKAWLNYLPSHPTSDQSLTRGEPVSSCVKKKKDWAGMNPAPWRAYWDHGGENYENIHEIARDAWKKGYRTEHSYQRCLEALQGGAEPSPRGLGAAACGTVTQHLTSWGRTKAINDQASKLTEEGGAGLTSHVTWTQLYPRDTSSVLFYLDRHLYTQE